MSGENCLRVRASIKEGALDAAILNNGCSFGAVAAKLLPDGPGIDVLTLTATGADALRELAGALKSIVQRIEQKVGEVPAKDLEKVRKPRGSHA